MAFPLNKQKIKSVYHKLSQVTPEAESKHNRKYFEREGQQQHNSFKVASGNNKHTMS